MVRIKSGIFGFAGIDFSFERVYGKSYQELKAEFIDFESEKWKGVETPSIHRLSSDIGEFVVTTDQRPARIDVLYWVVLESKDTTR